MDEQTKRKIIIKLVCIVLVAIFGALTYFAKTGIETIFNGEALATGTVDKANAANFSVHYMNVGDADCTFVKLPDGKCMIIDAGSAKTKDRVVNYLKKLNITKIDYLVLTHADEDHVGGMPAVLENFEVENIYRPFQIAVGNSYFEYEDPLSYYLNRTEMDVFTVESTCYAEFIKLAYKEKYDNEQDASVIVFYDGLVIAGEENLYRIEFLAPNKYAEDSTIAGIDDESLGYVTEYKTNSNNYSPVIFLKCFNSKFVFTGDMEKEAESAFVEGLDSTERAMLSGIDVLKAGHHGSSTSTSDALINLLNPSFVVFSCSSENEHPDNVVLQRVTESINNKIGSTAGKIFRTDKNGDVVFFCENNELFVCAYNFSATHYISWVEIYFVFVLICTIIIVLINPQKSSYKKVKKYLGKKKLVRKT